MTYDNQTRQHTSDAFMRDVQSSIIVLTEWRKTKDKQDDKNEEQIGKLVEATHKLQVDFVVFRGMGGDLEKYD